MSGSAHNKRRRQRFRQIECMAWILCTSRPASATGATRRACTQLLTFKSARCGSSHGMCRRSSGSSFGSDLSGSPLKSVRSSQDLNTRLQLPSECSFRQDTCARITRMGGSRAASAAGCCDAVHSMLPGAGCLAPAFRECERKIRLEQMQLTICQTPLVCRSLGRASIAGHNPPLHSCDHGQRSLAVAALRLADAC